MILVCRQIFEEKKLFFAGTFFNLLLLFKEVKQLVNNTTLADLVF